MQALLRSSLIVAGLALAAAVGSTPALAGHRDHGNKTAAQPKQAPARHPAPPAAYRQLNGNTAARQQNQTAARRPAPPAVYHQLYGNAPAAPKPARRDRNADRHHDDRNLVNRDRDRDRDRDHDRRWVDRRDYDRGRDRDWDDHRNIYVPRAFSFGFRWANDWDRYHDNGWLRYSAGRFGYIPRHSRVFVGYGADWMWWGGDYAPFDPPRRFRNCYPVIRYGYYGGRHAQLGGTMCYRNGDTYLLPNSVFVISIY